MLRLGCDYVKVVVEVVAVVVVDVVVVVAVVAEIAVVVEISRQRQWVCFQSLGELRHDFTETESKTGTIGILEG